MNYELTFEYLDECLDYNQVTGVILWKNRPQNHFLTKRAFGLWNTRFAGKRAGNIHLGYLRVRILGGSILAHRIAWFFLHGHWPSKQIDHINGIKSDNRPENLREASSVENQQNAKLRKDSSSGIKGVTFCKITRKWTVNLRINGKPSCLGRFASKDLARKTIEEARMMHHGAFANHGTALA